MAGITHGTIHGMAGTDGMIPGSTMDGDGTPDGDGDRIITGGDPRDSQAVHGPAATVSAIALLSSDVRGPV